MKTSQIILLGIGVFLIGLMLLAILFPGGSYGANVAIIPINGVITTESAGSLFSAPGTGSSDTMRLLDQANEDPSIEVILLEINSPGGTAVASDEIARTVEKLDKPVVAWIREVGASGGYWVASEADHIIANRMSITGSVGVIASYLEFNDFLEDHNITYQRMTGGEYKDIGSPFKDLEEDERDLLQAKIDRIHAFFIEDVQQNRNLSDAQMEEISTGIFFIGIEAYELGLVDELGGRDEVEAYLKALLNDEPTYYRYEPQRSFVEQLMSARVAMTPDLSSDLTISAR